MANPILVRQAIRKFKSDSITENDINELIRAFNASPCGLSQKVMSLTVIKSKEYLDMVEDKVGDAVYHAPLIFLISSQKDNQFGRWILPQPQKTSWSKQHAWAWALSTR